MEQTTTIEPTRSVVRGGALYRLIWKWHFIASLIVLPFMMMMATTGGIYLFADGIEERLYADRLHVTPQESQVAYSTLAAAAKLAGEDTLGVEARVVSFFASDDPNRSMVFEVENKSLTNEAENKITPRAVVWMNQYTGDVIAAQRKATMFMNVVERLHTHFLIGQVGEYFVEALACWAIVMFVTGIYLWWPRGSRKWSDVFKLPRGEGRPFWRATHLWTGFFTTLIIVPIIISGLFWTDVWGNQYLKLQLRMKHFSPILAYGGPPVFAKSQDGSLLPMEDLIQVARDAGITGTLEVRPPVAPKFGMLMRTEEALPMREQIELHVDTRTGELLRRASYDTAPPMAYFRSMAARFHLGFLYGDLNWYQNFLGVVLTLVLSVSGFVAWWKRRPEGSIGVPAAPTNPKLAFGLIVLVVALAVFLPLMGASLIAALVLDRLILRRLGWLQPSNSA